MSHTSFSLLKKKTIPSHKPLCMGVQPRYEHFNKTLLFFDCKSNSHYKDYMTDVTFVQSIPLSHAENSVSTLFLSGLLYHQEGYQTHDLRFLLKMQVSSLNAAPCSPKIVRPSMLKCKGIKNWSVCTSLCYYVETVLHVKFWLSWICCV